MRNSVYFLLLLLGNLFTSTDVFAQTNDVVESTMRSNNKIYVVMAICITILVGLLIYVISIDRKIAKLEDKQ